MTKYAPTLATALVIALIVWWIYFVITVADRLNVWPW